MEDGSLTAKLSEILGINADLDVDFSGGQLVLKIAPKGEKEQEMVSTECLEISAWSKVDTSVILQNFGVVLFSVISMVNGVTEIKVAPSF